MDAAQGVTEQKRQLRRRLLADRRARSFSDRRLAQSLIEKWLLAELTDQITVCGYLPLPSEPLALATLERLIGKGMKILLPVVTGAAPLDWAEFVPGGATVTGVGGMTEPAGARLGSSAAGAADVILVPALAVDPGGWRLGRGGGHYDRTLGLLHSLGFRPQLIAVLYDGEVLPQIPRDGFDVPVDGVVTPTGGIAKLGRTATHVAPDATGVDHR